MRNRLYGIQRNQARKQRRRSLRLESLENRKLLAGVTVANDGTDLYIMGTPGNGTVEVSWIPILHINPNDVILTVRWNGHDTQVPYRNENGVFLSNTKLELFAVQRRPSDGAVLCQSRKPGLAVVDEARILPFVG